MDEKIKKGTVMNLLEKMLSEQGLLEVSKNSVKGKESSWFIVLFHSIGGILSGLLILLLFAFPLYSMENSYFTMLALGIILLGFSYYLMHKNKSDFLEYFALVFSFTAQSLIIFSFGELELFEINTAMVLLAGFQIGLFFLFNSTLHRFISALNIIAIGFYFFALFSIDFMYGGLLLLVLTWLWLNEYSFLKYANHLRMFAYALVIFVFILSSAESFFWMHDLKDAMFANKYLDENINDTFSFIIYYLIGLGVMLMISMKYSLYTNRKLFVFLMLGTVAFYFFQPLGLEVSTSIIVLFLAFLGQNKVLWVLGMLSMVFSIFSYYSFMYIPFMQKSMQLILFGTIVLALAGLLHWYLKKLEGGSHA